MPAPKKFILLSWNVNGLRAVLKDGADYYLTFSSFDAYPGLTIWHSRDLVNWTLVTHALPKLVLQYRQLTKLKSTYVDALPALDPEDHERARDERHGARHIFRTEVIQELGRQHSHGGGDVPQVGLDAAAGEGGRRLVASFVC